MSIHPGKFFDNKVISQKQFIVGGGCKFFINISMYCPRSQPDIMYELPKIHKPDNPLRQILPTYKILSYRLEKFLLPCKSKL